MASRFLPLALLALTAALAEAADKQVYEQLGGTLVLKPAAFQGALTSITWKHKGNLLAEMNTPPEVEYYASFKGRTELDLKTGQITLKQLTKEDEGHFSVNVNALDQPDGFRLKLIKPPSTEADVEVILQPLACGPTNTDCSLSCLGNTADAEPIHYLWREDSGAWTEGGKERSITNDDKTKTIRAFSCKMKNPVGEKASAEKPNPFYMEPQSNVGATVGGIFGGLAILAVIVGVVLWLKKDSLKKRSGGHEPVSNPPE